MKLEIFKFSRWGGSGAARSPPSSTDASGITTTMTGGDRHCGWNVYEQSVWLRRLPTWTWWRGLSRPVQGTAASGTWAWRSLRSSWAGGGPATSTVPSTAGCPGTDSGAAGGAKCGLGLEWMIWDWEDGLKVEWMDKFFLVHIRLKL